MRAPHALVSTPPRRSASSSSPRRDTDGVVPVHSAKGRTDRAEHGNHDYVWTVLNFFRFHTTVPLCPLSRFMIFVSRFVLMSSGKVTS